MSLRRGMRVAAVAVAATVLLGGCAATGGQEAGPDAGVRSAAPGALPVGDLPGWHQVFRDGFSSPQLGRAWTRYSGRPGGDPAGWWDPRHATVGGGQLHLRTTKVGSRWVSAGVGSWRGLKLRYGKVDVRFRAPVAHGVSYAILLWPYDGRWPPEIDIAEDGGGNRRATTATLHYGSSNRQIARTVRADFTKWHTVSVQWSPGHLVYRLDGRVWGRVASTHVPSKRMVLALQTQVWPCSRWHSCPNRTTPLSSSVDVDWVAAYVRAS